MPAVIVAVAAVIGAAAASVGAGAVAAALSISVATATALVAGLVGAAINIVGAALFGLNKGPSPPLVNRLISERQPLPVWEVVYGHVRKGGAITFIGLSDKNDLHLVITLAAHQVQAIGEMYIAGNPVGLDAGGNGTGKVLDAKGNTLYTFENKVKVEKNLGAPDQAAFPDLIAANVGWTAAHTQSGRAGVHVHLIWNKTAFASFDPSQITFDVFGKADIYDPRTGTRGFSDNAALIVADYLCDTQFGLNADFDTEISASDLIAAANISDEMVDVAQVSGPLTVEKSGAHQGQLKVTEPLQLTGMWAPLLGDRVTLAVTGGALPSPLTAGTDYFWIPVNYESGTTEETAGGAITRVPDAFHGNLAASLADALAGNAIALGSNGSGTMTLTRTGERRYTANGAFTVDKAPRDILQSMLTALGGSAGGAIFTGGQWIVRAGAYIDPEIALDEDDLRADGFSVQMLQSRRDSYNAIKGSFYNPAADWQTDTYPNIVNPTYLAQDNNEQNWNQLDLPFTLSGSAAQRIATMELNRARLEKAIPQLPCKLLALQLRAGDTVMLNYARYGWGGKVFEVQAMALTQDQDAANAPILGVDLSLRETDPSAYAWSIDNELAPVTVPPSQLPSAGYVPAPGNPSVTEQLYVTAAGNAVKSQAVVTWAASSFAAAYHTEYAPSGTDDWTVRAPVRDTADTIQDMVPGLYDVRVQAENSLGALSPYATTLGVEISGLSSPPQDVTGFSIQSLSGFAHLRWDLATDIAVLNGGYGRVRFTPAAPSDAAWQNATDLGPRVSPTQTSEVLPLPGAGTVMMKWINCNGIESPAAALFAVDAPASLVTLGSGITVTESPGFAGVKTDCAAVGGILKLASSEDIDTIPDIDSVPAIDAAGGIVASGTYDFATVLDQGSVTTARLSAVVALETVSVLDLIDERSGMVDDWTDIDGAASAVGDAQLLIASTDDDPAGSPVWSDFAPLSLADQNHRAFKPRLRLTTSDAAFTPEISTLSLTASPP